MTMKKKLIGLCLLLALCQMHSAAGGELLRSNFDDEPSLAGWTGSAGTSVMAYGREGRSLMISNAPKGDGTANWTSPAFAVSGPAVSVSCWMAENYTSLSSGGRDEMQLAAVAVESLDKDGKSLGAPWDLLRTDYRMADVLAGSWIEPDGLRWCYREAKLSLVAGATQARLVFHFPRNTTRGRVFMDEIKVEVANQASATAEKKVEVQAWPENMLVNTPAPHNVFTIKEDLRFDIAFWGAIGADKKPRKAEIPQGAVIKWNVTDYLEERLAEGEIGVDKRQPFAAYNKGECELLSIIAGEELKKRLGALLYFEAKLVSGDKVLATDTASFIVTDPKPATTPEQLANSHFEGGSGDRLGITASTIADASLSTWLDKDAAPESVIKLNKPESRRPASVYLLYAQCSQTKVGITPENKNVYYGYPQWIFKPWENEQLAKDAPNAPNQLDWDAFGKWMGAVAKAYSAEYQVLSLDPAASERHYSELAHRMQVAGYKGIKAVDPNFPVGFSSFGMYSSEDYFEKFLAKGAFDYCDVIDDHVYTGSHAVRAMAKRIDGYYHKLEKMGKKKKFITTEMSAVGTLDHQAKATDQIQMVLDLMAAHVTYFNCFYAGFWPSNITKPSLREWPRTGEQFEQFCFSDPINGPKICSGTDKINGRRDMPLLRMTAMYNLQRFLGWSEYRETLAADNMTNAYVFEQDGHSILTGYRLPSGSDKLFLLKAPGAHSLKLVDIFGRESNVAIDGDAGVVVALHESPAFLVFDAVVKGMSLAPLDGQLAPTGAFTVGKAVPITFKLAACPADWQGAKADLRLGKPYIQPQPTQLAAAAKSAVEVAWQLEIPDNTPLRAGAVLSVEKGGITLALVDSFWKQADPVKVTVDTEPLMPGKQPAVLINVKNSGGKDWQGKVEIDNPYFAAPGKAPASYSQDFAVKSGTEGNARFEVTTTGELKTNQIYPTTVRVTVPGEPLHAWQQNLSFIACRKSAQPIKVDASLEDWDLKSLVPLEFPRALCTRNTWYDKTDCWVKVYTRWDAENLYIAYDWEDNVWHNTATDNQIWVADAIMQSIFPGTIEPGKQFTVQATRAHLGLNAKEEPVLDMADQGSTTLGDKQGVQFAAKRSGNHIILEMAYPFTKLGQLRGALGNKFRMADWIFDHDAPNVNLRGLAMFAYVSHVDRNPDYWADWKMTE